MKPLYLAVFLLIVIIAGCIFSIYYVDKQADMLHKYLVELENDISSENWGEADSQYKNFKKKWMNIDHKWSMLIDHYEIDYINMDLGELEAYIKTKDKASALAKVSSLQLLVKHIPEKEYPSIKNLM